VSRALEPNAAPGPAGPDRAPELSVVTMLYRSEPWVRRFYERIVPAAESLDASFEIVFVNDGSPDAAASEVRRLVQTDPRVVLVDLSRNFGHHQAAVAGLRHARGERVFIIDVDLEEQPEWLPRFWREQRESGADVVFGVNSVRRGTAFRRHVGGSFWKLFNVLSEVQIPHNPCTVRLMSRRYVDALLTLPDKNLFLAGNYAWLGFRQLPIGVQKEIRPTRSSYTIGRLFSLFLDAVTSFTSYPLRLIFFVGVTIAAVALLFGSVLVAWKTYSPGSISLGWSSLIVSIWFLGGIVIAFLGVIGIYLSKVFTETKNRPLYVVQSVERGASAAPRPLPQADGAGVDEDAAVRPPGER
jgi:putative glycosyltransferase